MPMGAPVVTVAPGLTGTAPTRTSGAVPGIASEETTLWLGSVPLLHAVLRETAANPAARRAARAAAIFNPITFGTVLCGRVVVVGAVTVVDVGGTVVVVLRMERTAFFCAAVGELPPHDDRKQTATRAAAPRAATRPPTCTAPSL